MSCDGQSLEKGEVDPTQAQEEEPPQEKTGCSPGQLPLPPPPPPPPDEEASKGSSSHSQSWLLDLLDDARYIICCTNWY